MDGNEKVFLYFTRGRDLAAPYGLSDNWHGLGDVVLRWQRGE